VGGVRERSRCGDREGQAIIEAGTDSVEWLREEFTGVDLGANAWIVAW
jgi:hypothetical protein